MVDLSIAMLNYQRVNDQHKIIVPIQGSPRYLQKKNTVLAVEYEDVFLPKFTDRPA